MAESALPADIFNSRYFDRQSSPASGAGMEFPLFAQLPRELRLQIWAWHLPRRRFLRVLLEESGGAQQGGSEPEPEVFQPDDDDEWASIFAAGPSETEAGTETETETEIWPSVGSTAPLLRVTFLGAPSPVMPALRLVCREARDAHNSVYRIRLPSLARIPWGVGTRDCTTTRIVAHLNSELDILSLQTPSSSEIVALNLLPLFLHHLLQHDFSPSPLRFGVRHLCVDLRHLGSDYRDSGDKARPDGPAPLAPDVLASVRLAVSHLRGLYLRLTTSHLEPRVMSGPFANTRSLPWYNASVPVLPGASWGFPGEVGPVPGGDPRLADPEGAADLRQVWIGSQLRPSLDVWAGLRRAWVVPARGAGIRVRALYGRGRTDCGGGRGSSLRAYLREERAAWRSLTDPATEMGAPMRECFQNAQRTFLPGHLVVAPEEWISRREPHTAVGFWLIDPEVLEAAQTTGHVGKKIVNLSGAAEDIELRVLRGHS
ncbi:hypothetical protein SLS64_009028 [Diaporthe eres]